MMMYHLMCHLYSLTNSLSFNHNSIDFESLSYEKGPEKVIARLQLLISPAIKSPDSKKRPLISWVNKDKIELIEDNGHEGCGFVSKEM